MANNKIFMVRNYSNIINSASNLNLSADGKSEVIASPTDASISSKFFKAFKRSNSRGQGNSNSNLTGSKMMNRDKLKKKKSERGATLAKLKLEYQMSPEYRSIIELSFDNLIERLQYRKISAAKVLSAFLAHTIEGTIACNCVTEFNPNAMKIAKLLDGSSTNVGPFHGLPIAVSDDIDLRGMDTTLGYSSRLYKNSGDTAALIRVLQDDLGCIPFIKTNVPQTLFSLGSENPIFGKTLNPLNVKCGPGGTCSGGGALVALGGVLISLGTDLFGGVRIPAHFNGICGLRPTSNRLSSKGILQCFPNSTGIMGVPGLLSKRAKIIASIFKALTENKRQHKVDPLTVPLPWDNQVFLARTPLKIGYFTTLHFFPTMGDTSKTIKRAKTYLESLGHSFISFQLPDTFDIMKLSFDLLASDQYKQLNKRFQGESEISPDIQDLYDIVKTPLWKRKFDDFMYRYPWHTMRRLKPFIRAGLDVEKSSKFMDLNIKKQELTRSILNQMEEKDLDLILCPVFPCAAPKIADLPKLMTALPYTLIWNITDFPCGVVPFGRESGRSLNEFDTEGDNSLKLAKESAKESVGMPIAVQIVSKPFNEEVVLRVMVELDRANFV